MERNNFDMNYTFKYSLDKSSKKFTCPSCGKTRFVRYIDNSTNTYLPVTYGRCDRDINCGYHLKPGNEINKNDYLISSMSLLVTKNPDYIPYEILRTSLDNYKQNNFIQFLKTIFSRDIITYLIKYFLIGTSTYWPGATIFWQIDKNEQIHSGKIMLYDSASGKRVKEPFPHIQWVHKVTYIKDDFNLKQCLFGEHQLSESPEEKIIAIVESEKTAILMTAYFPDAIWMATGSLSNINPFLFSSIRDRDIILYPDLNGFIKWKEKADLLIEHGFKVIVSNLLEKKASVHQKEEGFDIADFYINSTLPFMHSIPESPKVPALTKDEVIFNQMARKNPHLLDFVNTLGLVNTKTGMPFSILN
jgi:hypothetical protein